MDIESQHQLQLDFDEKIKNDIEMDISSKKYIKSQIDLLSKSDHEAIFRMIFENSEDSKKFYTSNSNGCYINSDDLSNKLLWNIYQYIELTHQHNIKEEQTKELENELIQNEKAFQEQVKNDLNKIKQEPQNNQINEDSLKYPSYDALRAQALSDMDYNHETYKYHQMNQYNNEYEKETEQCLDEKEQCSDENFQSVDIKKDIVELAENTKESIPEIKEEVPIPENKSIKKGKKIIKKIEKTSDEPSELVVESEEPSKPVIVRKKLVVKRKNLKSDESI